MQNVLRNATVIMPAASTAGFVALMHWSLLRVRRVTLHGVTTIDEAVSICRRSGLTGWELVASARQLAARAFSYSRRNPWVTPGRAFARGMGYCQQPVYALQCRFPPELERISPHTWLRRFTHFGSVIENIRRDRLARQQEMRADHAAGAV